MRWIVILQIGDGEKKYLTRSALSANLKTIFRSSIILDDQKPKLS